MTKIETFLGSALILAAIFGAFYMANGAQPLPV